MLERHQHYQQSSSFGPIFLACPAPSYLPGHGWSNFLLGSDSLFDANGGMASLSFGNNHNNNAFGFPFAARSNNAVASLGASDRVRANNGEVSSNSTTSSSFGCGAPSRNGGFQANIATFPLCASFGGAANASILFGTSSFEHSSSSHHNNNQLPLARTAESEMLSVVKALTDFGNILPTRQPFVVHADHHCLTPCLNFNNNNTEERDDNRGSFEGTINAHTKDLVIAAFFGLLHPQSQRLGDITFTTVRGTAQQVIALKDLKQSSECTTRGTLHAHVTFTDQKSAVRGEYVGHRRLTMSDPCFCPVAESIAIIGRTTTWTINKTFQQSTTTSCRPTVEGPAILFSGSSSLWKQQFRRFLGWRGIPWDPGIHIPKTNSP